jgi:hypothetical protein
MSRGDREGRETVGRTDAGRNGSETTDRSPGASTVPASRGPEYGETWAYESIIGALPGIDISERAAFAIQFALFETAVLVLAAYYGLWEGAVVGTATVALATGGSFGLLRISKLVRRADPPEAYERAVFGSSIDVVLGVLAFIALVTYLFVLDPRDGSTLVAELLGERPPLPVVYLSLLVAWDVCYRIGTGWWATVVALWRSVTTEFDPESRRVLARADLETMGFGLSQAVLVPFLLDHPVLLFAVVGHVVAVVVVTGLSVVALSVRDGPEDRATS